MVTVDLFLTDTDTADANEVANQPGTWVAHIGGRKVTIFGTADQLRAVAEGILADLPAVVTA